MKLTKITPIATSLVLTVFHADVFAGSQDPSSDDEEVAGIFQAPPAAQKKRSHTNATAAQSTTFVMPSTKRRRAPQQSVIIINDDQDSPDESSPPASGSSTCDPVEDQDQTTPEERLAQVLPLLSPEFRKNDHLDLVENFVWGFQDGHVFQRILTELKRVNTEKRFFAMNFVTARLQYPHLLDEDEEEIIDALQAYDGSKIVVPRTPPATPRR